MNPSKHKCISCRNTTWCAPILLCTTPSSATDPTCDHVAAWLCIVCARVVAVRPYHKAGKAWRRHRLPPDTGVVLVPTAGIDVPLHDNEIALSLSQGQPLRPVIVIDTTGYTIPS